MFHRVTSAPLSRSYVPRVPLTQAHKTRKKNKKSNRAFPIHCLAWSVQTKKAEYIDTHLKLSCIILEWEVWFGLLAFFVDHCGVKRNNKKFSFPLFASLKKSGKCDGRGRAIKTEIFFVCQQRHQLVSLLIYFRWETKFMRNRRAEGW